MTWTGTFVRRNFEPLVLSLQVVVDLAVILLACWLGWLIGREVGGGRPQPLEVSRELWALTAAVMLLAFHAFGMYSPVKSILNVEEFKGVTKSVLVAFPMLLALIVLLRTSAVGAEAGRESWIYAPLVWFHRRVDLDLSPDSFSRLTLVLSFLLIWFFSMISRFLSFKAIQHLHRRGIGNRNVLIAGTSAVAQRLARKFVEVPTLGLRLCGFVTGRADEVGRVLERRPVLGELGDLGRLIERHKVGEVFLALPEAEEERVLALAQELERLGVTYRIVPRFWHLMAQRVKLETLDSIPLLSRPEGNVSLASALAKRALDVLVAGTVLLLALPLFAVAALLIRRESPGPVFFRQKRVGQSGAPFVMLKFRTMFVHLSGDALKPRDEQDPRITDVGRWLRRYSLDELPQFLNVLRGEMSVVGPRPEMEFLVEAYGPLERERLRAKPGITGLWQISYHRGTKQIHENIDYDIYYVENRSLMLDLVIIFLTVFAVARGTGAH
jgi:exopolysaccharide biosynthesis polyprenyl glycosylphosphotransferase